MKHLLNFEQLMEQYNSEPKKVTFIKDKKPMKVEEPSEDEKTEEEIATETKTDLELKLQNQ